MKEYTWKRVSVRSSSFFFSQSLTSSCSLSSVWKKISSSLKVSFCSPVSLSTELHREEMLSQM